MANYKIEKRDGRWTLRFKDNEPIPHRSFEGALATLWDLTRLTTHHKNTQSR